MKGEGGEGGGGGSWFLRLSGVTSVTATQGNPGMRWGMRKVGVTNPLPASYLGMYKFYWKQLTTEKEQLDPPYLFSY